MELQKIKKSLDIVAVIGRHIHLDKRGSEYVGLCPFHSDTKPSLMVNQRKQLWSCFACGVGGDVVDFLTKRGMSMQEIAEQYGEREPARAVTPAAQTAPQTPAKRPAVVEHPQHGRPAAVWEYQTASGETWGLVCRFDKSGGKVVLPYTYRAGAWGWKGFDEPRPLYNLPAVLAADWVMVVEGEKAADAGQRLFPKIAVTSWQGGASAWGKSDWSVLRGKNVVLWPDNDAPGRQAMTAVAGLLAPIAGKVMTVQAADWMTPKWDLADANWTAAEAAQYLRENSAEVQPAAPAPVDEIETIQADEHTDGEHFTVLGFVRDESKTLYAVYTMANKVVNLFSASALNTSNLISIAPLFFWQTAFPKPRGAFDINAAADWIIRLADSRGVFSLSNMRGRGVWIDDGRVVIHAGSHLIVNDVMHRLGSLQTRYIYEAAPSVYIHPSALSDSEARDITLFVDSLNFARPLDKMLLAGWIALAPVCGALRWRPHIWITGAAGSGKSWIAQNLVRTLTGDMAHNVQGETTEAGLRQLLGSDALPVVFDEAEGNDAASRARIDGVLSLARAASTGEGGKVAKGSANGKAALYEVKTMMCLSSILPAVTLKSDLGRFSLLEYGGVDDRVPWAQKLSKYRSIVGRDTGARLIRRTMNNLPRLLENIELLVAAVAAELNDQRMADQVGTLLAGYLSLGISEQASPAIVKSMFSRVEFGTEKLIASGSDEDTLRGLLLSGIIRMDNGRERTVDELCDIALGLVDEPFIEPQQAADTLLRHGFRADTDGLVVSSSHGEVRRLLAGTQFERNHARTLMRLAGSVAMDSVRFKGSIQRAVKIRRS
jgi:putative DNA primase/helicase